MNEPDPPEEFDRLSATKRQAILEWLRLAYVPRKGVAVSSYALKHECEDACGFYVSNGEIKGASRRAGYRSEPMKAGPNWWIFGGRRCRHQGTADTRSEPTCPHPHPTESLSGPGLCQATEAEYAAFLALAKQAVEEGV